MSNQVYPSPFRGLAFTVTKTPIFATTVQSAPSFVETRILNSINPIWEWQLMYEVLFNVVSRSTPGFAPYTDLQELLGFFLARNGQFDDFLYDDVDDDSVTNQTMQFVNDGAGNYYTPIQRNMGGQFFEDVTDLNPQNGSGLSVKITGSGSPVTASGFLLAGPGLSIPGFSFMGKYIAWAWRVRHGGGAGVYQNGDTLIDPAGHLQIVTAGGGSSNGSSLPAFNDTGGTTTDGGITWTDNGVVTAVTASFSFYFRVRFATDKLDFEKFVYNLWTIGGSEGKNGSGILKLRSARAASI